MCHGQLWLIDHGASLFIHHRWAGWRDRIQSSFPQIAQHVLLPFAGDIDDADTRLRPRLNRATLEVVIDTLPEEWLGPDEEFSDAEAQRRAYLTYLQERLDGPRAWLTEAIAARRNGSKPLSVRETHIVDRVV